MNRIVSSLSALILTANCYALSTADRKSPDWDFNNPELGKEWSRLGNTSREDYSLTERGGFLRIKSGGDTLQSSVLSSLVGRPQEHRDFQSSTRFEVSDGATAGMTVYLAASSRYDLCVSDGRIHLRHRVGENSGDKELEAVPTGFIEVKVKGTPEEYKFYYSVDGVKFKEAGCFSASELGGIKPNAYIGLFSEGKGYADFDFFKYREVIPEGSPKLISGNGNPLLDFQFTADPTAVEHEGRLYVYATNDHQQFEEVGRDGKNTYERIKSLVMMSTDDMVNWTYHGNIDVGNVAPWIMASWAPSIVKRKEEDGKTHFYLYFSNSGFGTGVLTATSPVGPWTSPLDKSLVDANTSGLGKCKVPFDPGAVIDPDGTGWLTIGAGNSCIMRLGADMISIDSELKELKAPHHFEANELNYINGTYVYTYNTDWKDRGDWNVGEEVPSICSMSYMTSKTPLDPDSWKYHHHYLKNPGDYGFDYSNNHTHLHKYQGKWYLFYHTMSLQNSFNTDGGFRNVCVDEIDVDEDNLDIPMGDQTLKGPSQIKMLNPFALQQAETTAATKDVRFVSGDTSGNMVATTVGDEALIMVRGVLFSKRPRQYFAKASGKGVIEVRQGGATGNLIATVEVNSSQNKFHKVKLTGVVGNSPCDLCFILKGNDITFDAWQFK
ncbi:family 43 glycosylhydrolase [Duncaniella freteri]|uniref:beta-xylosidase family glycoside hydrolase n=3 Tax=Duncaniella TaxID=2518495 RepID=UPI0013F9465D|nr:family 43 glycosylhydrolase [Duncaniella freteri]NBJ08998.1 hypothetical protein [Alistipes sp. Z76]NCE71008.1 hypothetical protein [Muribaculaceae bacterium M3]